MLILGHYFFLLPPSLRDDVRETAIVTGGLELVVEVMFLAQFL